MCSGRGNKHYDEGGGGLFKSTVWASDGTDLLGGDAADDTLLHPVDHVLLLHPAVEVLQGNLVVQAPLHLIGHHV